MQLLRKLKTWFAPPASAAAAVELVPPGPLPAPPEIVLSREQKILAKVDKAGWGVEIGPSYSPVAPKKAGYNVHVIDHATQAELVEKYTPHKMPVENIEPVDFVWHGEPYAELTGHPNFYDWVIASHVIEHTPNLIGFLENCANLLKPTGVLSLVVPDLRYCFDHYRPPTTIARIVDAHLQKQVRHTPGTACEHVMSVMLRGGQPCWNTEFSGEYAFMHPASDGPLFLQQAIQNETYLDFHAWCFTPSSFRLLIQDLHTLGFTQFREVAFFQTVNCEFYITLALQGPLPNHDRLHLLKQIRAELVATE